MEIPLDEPNPSFVVQTSSRAGANIPKCSGLLISSDLPSSHEGINNLIGNLASAQDCVIMEGVPYRCRRMRRFWRWHEAIFGISCLITFVIELWRDVHGLPDLGWTWLIPFAVGGLLMLHLHRF